mgnify:FL=1
MKNIKYTYITAAALEVLTVIFWFVPSFSTVKSVSHYVLEDTMHVNLGDYSLFSYFSDMVFIPIASLIGVAVSLFLIVSPIIRDKCEERHKMIYPKITAIYSAVLYIIIYISACSDARNYADIGGKASMKFGGVVFVILNIALLIQLFMISVKTKQLSKQTVQNAASNPSDFIQNV